jgi:ubiquinone/menaquinone biosynthesis C-methylase UbiE
MTADESDRRSTAFVGPSSVPEDYERRLRGPLFEPWAEILVDAVGVRSGDRVLDIASGTGVVARLAAARAARSGRVVASDVSGAMLAHAASLSVSESAAPIEYVEASVSELPFDDGEFDVVFCQQGIQFFPDRAAATAEMLRVLRSGGRIGLSVWTAGRRLEPFDEYIEALVAAEIEAPFRGAFDPETFKLSADELSALLEATGFASVEVGVLDHEVVWSDAESVASGILGTPFAPLLDQLSSERRSALEADLVRRFAPASPGADVRRVTSAVVAQATAPSA